MSEMPAEFMALMERFNELGRLLPTGDDDEVKELIRDPHKLAEMKLVLAEMDKVDTEIKRWLNRH